MNSDYRYEVNLYPMNEAGEPEDYPDLFDKINVWVRVDKPPFEANTFTDIPADDRDFHVDDQHDAASGVAPAMDRARKYARELADKYRCEINEY